MAMLRSLYQNCSDPVIGSVENPGEPIIVWCVGAEDNRQSWAVARTNFATGGAGDGGGSSKTDRRLQAVNGDSVHYLVREINLTLESTMDSSHQTVLSLQHAGIKGGKRHLKWSYYDSNGLPPYYPKPGWQAIKEALHNMLTSLYADSTVAYTHIEEANLGLQSVSPGQYELGTGQAAGWCTMYATSYLLQQSKLPRKWPTNFYRLKLLLCDLNSINDRLMHENYAAPGTAAQTGLAAVYSVLPQKWGAGTVCEESNVWAMPEPELRRQIDKLRRPSGHPYLNALTCNGPHYTRYNSWEAGVGDAGVLVSLGWNSFPGCPGELPELETFLLRALYRRVHLWTRPGEHDPWAYTLSASSATMLATDACALAAQLRQLDIDSPQGLLQILAEPGDAGTPARTILDTKNIGLLMKEDAWGLAGVPVTGVMGQEQLLRYIFDVVYWTTTEVRNIRYDLVRTVSSGYTPEDRISAIDVALNYVFKGPREQYRAAFCEGYLKEKYPDYHASRPSLAGYSMRDSMLAAVTLPSTLAQAERIGIPDPDLDGKSLAHIMTSEELEWLQLPSPTQRALRLAEEQRIAAGGPDARATIMAEGHFYGADGRARGPRNSSTVWDAYGNIRNAGKYSKTIIGYSKADKFERWRKTSEPLPLALIGDSTDVRVKVDGARRFQMERTAVDASAPPQGTPCLTLPLTAMGGGQRCLLYDSATDTLIEHAVFTGRVGSEPRTGVKPRLRYPANAETASLILQGATSQFVNRPTFLKLCRLARRGAPQSGFVQIVV